MPDGEIATACQADCPTQAIVFGDLHDPKSEVSVQVESPRSYKLVEEINVKPRVSYLAKIRFGLRAIEKETGHLAPEVGKLNFGLGALDSGLRSVEGELGRIVENLTGGKP